MQKLSKEALVAVGQFIPAGVVVIEKENDKVNYVNQRAVELLGFNPCGLSFKEYAINMAKARNLENGPYIYEQLPLIKALLYGQTTHNQEIIIQRPKQTQLSIIVNATPLSDEKGNITGALALFEDITERKKAEEALKESEDRLRVITESSIIDISVSRPNGTILFVNSAYAKTFGYNKEELIGFHAPNLYVNSKDREKLVEILKRQGFVKNYEVQVKRKDGTLFWVAASIECIRFGGKQAFVGTSIDISKRKQAEEALKESEQLYRTLFENTEEGFQLLKPIYDEAGKPCDLLVLKVNKAYERQTGLKDSDVVGKTVKEFIPTIEPYWISTYGKVAKTGKSIHIENHNQSTNRWYDVYAFLYAKDQVGALFRDITERKKSEEALRQSEERFFKTFHSNPAAMSISRLPDGVWVDVNESFLRLTEFSREEIIGHTSIELNLFVGDPTERAQILNLLCTQGNVNNLEISALTKTGKPLRLLLSAVKTVMSGQEYALTTQIDITERKKLEKQLQEKERMAAIGETAGMVGHDLRNPLQSIVSELYLAKCEVSLMPEGQNKANTLESIENISEQISYMDKIVSDLQTFVKPVEARKQTVNLKPLITLLLAQTSIPTSIQTNLHIPEALNVEADPQLLKRVLINLVTNAVQAMPDGGELTIKAQTKAKGLAQITVEDTGTGIPEEIKPKIFTPLFTTKSKGQGFGLAVCKRVIEAQGGTISFESEVGKGTKFTIILPSKR